MGGDKQGGKESLKGNKEAIKSVRSFDDLRGVQPKGFKETMSHTKKTFDLIGANIGNALSSKTSWKDIKTGGEKSLDDVSSADKTKGKVVSALLMVPGVNIAVAGASIAVMAKKWVAHKLGIDKDSDKEKSSGNPKAASGQEAEKGAGLKAKLEALGDKIKDVVESFKGKISNLTKADPASEKQPKVQGAGPKQQQGQIR